MGEEAEGAPGRPSGVGCEPTHVTCAALGSHADTVGG
jgi:hypothetical protein